MNSNSNGYIKVSLSSLDLLPLATKKTYINKLYGQRATYQKDKKRHNGFVNKFNNSIGFKPITFEYDNVGVVAPRAFENPEDYLTPAELIFDSMATPVCSFEIAEFYIPRKKFVHTEQQFNYDTTVMAQNWKGFLSKVFPELITTIDIIDEKPKPPLSEFAFEFFYRNLDRDVNCTIEFSSSEKIPEKELAYMLPRLQKLCDDKITVAQFKCDTCAEHNPVKNIHIEIVYLTWYGKQRDEKEIFEEYGNNIFIREA